DATAGAAVWEDISTVDDPMVFQGAWDASSGTFPGGGDAQAGYIYVVSVAGEVDSVQFDVGDHIYAIVDDADENTYAANWQRIEGVVPDVGKVIAVESTVAAFPDAADYAGWLAFLDVQDVLNKPGFYLSD